MIGGHGMTAREKFKSLGFTKVIEDKYGIEYQDGEVEWGRKSIFIDKQGNVTAEQYSYAYGELAPVSLELSKDMLTAVLMQLKEFDIELM